MRRFKWENSDSDEEQAESGPLALSVAASSIPLGPPVITHVGDPVWISGPNAAVVPGTENIRNSLSSAGIRDDSRSEQVRSAYSDIPGRGLRKTQEDLDKMFSRERAEALLEQLEREEEEQDNRRDQLKRDMKHSRDQWKTTRQRARRSVNPPPLTRSLQPVEVPPRRTYPNSTMSDKPRDGFSPGSSGNGAPSGFPSGRKARNHHRDVVLAFIETVNSAWGWAFGSDPVDSEPQSSLVRKYEHPFLPSFSEPRTQEEQEFLADLIRKGYEHALWRDEQRAIRARSAAAVEQSELAFQRAVDGIRETADNLAQKHMEVYQFAEEIPAVAITFIVSRIMSAGATLGQVISPTNIAFDNAVSRISKDEMSLIGVNFGLQLARKCQNGDNFRVIKNTTAVYASVAASALTLTAHFFASTSAYAGAHVATMKAVAFASPYTLIPAVAGGPFALVAGVASSTIIVAYFTEKFVLEILTESTQPVQLALDSVTVDLERFIAQSESAKQVLAGNPTAAVALPSFSTALVLPSRAVTGEIEQHVVEIAKSLIAHRFPPPPRLIRKVVRLSRVVGPALVKGAQAELWCLNRTVDTIRIVSSLVENGGNITAVKDEIKKLAAEINEVVWDLGPLGIASVYAAIAVALLSTLGRLVAFVEKHGKWPKKAIVATWSWTRSMLPEGATWATLLPAIFKREGIEFGPELVASDPGTPFFEKTILPSRAYRRLEASQHELEKKLSIQRDERSYNTHPASHLGNSSSDTEEEDSSDEASMANEIAEIARGDRDGLGVWRFDTVLKSGARQRLPWTDVKEFVLEQSAAYIRTFAKNSLGFEIPPSKVSKTALIEQIESWMSKAPSSSSSSSSVSTPLPAAVGDSDASTDDESEETEKTFSPSTSKIQQVNYLDSDGKYNVSWVQWKDSNVDLETLADYHPDALREYNDRQARILSSDADGEFDLSKAVFESIESEENRNGKMVYGVYFRGWPEARFVSEEYMHLYQEDAIKKYLDAKERPSLLNPKRLLFRDRAKDTPEEREERWKNADAKIRKERRALIEHIEQLQEHHRLELSTRDAQLRDALAKQELLIAEHRAAPIREGGQTVAQLSSQLDALRQGAIKLQDQLKVAESQLDTARSECKVLKEQLKEEEDGHDDTLTEIEKLDKTVKSLQDQIAELGKGRVDVDKLNQLAKQREDDQARIISEQAAELKKAHSNLREANAKLDALKTTQRNESEFAKMESALQSKTLELNKLKTDLARREDDLSQLRRDSSQKIASRDAELVSLRQKVPGSQMKFAELSASVVNLRADLQRVTIERDGLVKELADVRQLAVTSSANTIAALKRSQQEVHDLHAQVQHYENAKVQVGRIHRARYLFTGSSKKK